MDHTFNTPPTKTDLLKVLRSLQDWKPAEIEKLREIESIASEALEVFCHTNKEYLKLKAADENASEVVYQRTKEEREERLKKIQVCRNDLYSRGLTNDVIEGIRALVDEYSKNGEPKIGW